VVDDLEFNRKLLLGYINAKGIAKLEAVNGEEAVEMAKSRGPDLVLMDVKMPVMDGLEATAAIHALPGMEHVPVIAISASAMREDVELYGKVFDGVLCKPVSRLDLYSMLRRFLPHELVPATAGARAAPPPSPAPDGKAGLPELAARTLTSRWQAREGMSTDELKRFGRLAESMGAEHGCGALRDWGGELFRAASSFDIAATGRCLDSFPKLLELSEGPR